MTLTSSFSSSSGAPPNAGEPPPVRPTAILLVEDDEVDVMAFDRAVREAVRQGDLHAEVERAASLQEARALLEPTAGAGQRFDCVVLDYQLPDGDAMALLPGSREDLLNRPPIIILTGYGSESVAVELMKAGAYDYLPKDELTPSRIAQSLRNALRVRSGEEALRQAYDELEERVEERTSALEKANRELGQEMADRRSAEDRARQHLEQLAHVARLSTMGELATGLAHELNQPLGAIANYANGCIRRLDLGKGEPEVLKPALEKIAAQALRAGQIIQRLRRFVRAGEPRREPADIGQLLREVVELENVDARYHGAGIELQLSPDLPRVSVDTIQVQQVVLNLVRNGMEAMETRAESEDDAELEVADQVQPPRKLTIIARGFKAGSDVGDSPSTGGVEVVIADRGHGCAPETLERIFDPFFSTKKSGMGLGLAISRSLIEAQGGRMWAEAREGGGLEMHFTLLAEAEDA